MGVLSNSPASGLSDCTDSESSVTGGGTFSGATPLALYELLPAIICSLLGVAYNNL